MALGGLLFSINLSASADTQPLDVVVIFKQDAAAQSPLDAAPTPAAALKDRARRSRPPLSDLLPNRGSALAPGQARPAGDLWLVNGYSLRLTADEARRVADDPRVAAVIENFTVRTPELLPASRAGGDPRPDNWALDKIGARQAWGLFGVTGRHVRIGHLDTGIDATHPDLQGKVAAWAEFNGIGQRIYSSPHDSHVHGTHTAGLLVGGSAEGYAVGAAPGAELLSAMVLNSNGGTLIQVIAGMQWVLDPDEDPATDDGAQILSVSLGAPGQYEVFETIVNTLVEAGVLPVFAIGNSGPDTTSAPANTPGALAVGATTPSDEVAYFSSGGVASWNGASYTKPELSAPGMNIPSTVPGGRYLSFSGTSMATPLVAATAALLKEKDPSLTAQRMREILEETSVDLGDPGLDERYGHGRLDALAALVAVSGDALVRGAVTPPPSLAVQVNAKDAAGRSVRSVPCDPETGRFQMVLPAGAYTLEAGVGALALARREVSAPAGSVMDVDLALAGSLDGLDHLLVYPNPFKPSRGDAAVTFAGLPDGSRVAIFSLSGQQLLEISASASGLAAWDGRDNNGQALGSGLYYYVATHRNPDTGGFARKRGKLAVIR